MIDPRKNFSGGAETCQCELLLPIFVSRSMSEAILHGSKHVTHDAIGLTPEISRRCIFTWCVKFETFRQAHNVIALDFDPGGPPGRVLRVSRALGRGLCSCANVRPGVQISLWPLEG